MDLFETLYRENKKLSRINEDVKINPDWKDELRHRLIVINDDGYLCDSAIVDCCKDLHYDYPDVDFDEAYDYAYSLVEADDLYEDTVKQANGKWVNKGKEGTHGEFKTKKAADAQRKAMFANGFKSESVSKIFTVHVYQAYPYIGAIELNDQLDKNGEGKKLTFTSREDLEDKANELLSQGYTSNNYDTYQGTIEESSDSFDYDEDSEADQILYDAISTFLADRFCPAFNIDINTVSQFSRFEDIMSNLVRMVKQGRDTIQKNDKELINKICLVNYL